MTLREKLIVTAYTGILMVDFPTFHKFGEELLGRSMFTHEFGRDDVVKEIKSKVRADFMALCEDDQDE